MLKPHTIRFRVTDKEFAALTIIAEQLGHTVSQVVRDKLFSPDAAPARAATGADAQPRSRRGKAHESSTHAIVSQRGANAQMPGRMVEVRAAPAAEGACPHRKRAGEVCYKCDLKMGYPRI